MSELFFLLFFFNINPCGIKSDSSEIPFYSSDEQDAGNVLIPPCYVVKFLDVRGVHVFFTLMFTLLHEYIYMVAL